jgi:hypothetical protein
MDVAKDMIKESLPIKCLEAVILGLYPLHKKKLYFRNSKYLISPQGLNSIHSYLTNGIPGLDRFPLSFRTVFNRNIYNHVVLAVYHNGYYGSIGMSRRKDLMDKPLVFKVQSIAVDIVMHLYQLLHVADAF